MKEIKTAKGENKIPSSKTEIIIRYAETDQMGVVHHSVYPVYFEAGRTDFFSKFIAPYSAMEKMGIWAPVISFTCQLKSTAGYGDILIVKTIPSYFTGIKLQIRYEAYIKGASDIIATGDSIHTFITPERKIIRISSYPEIHQKLKSVFPEKK